MMRVTCILAMALMPAGAISRPLLPDSQQTYAGTCLEAELASAQLVPICEAALADPGASRTQRRDMMLELADALYGIDALDRADNVLDEVLLNDPQTARAWMIKGWVAWDRDAYDTAQAHFQKSVDLAPTARALSGLASASRHAGTLPHHEVITLLDAAIAISPNYIWAIREKGWALIDEGAFSEAEAAFRSALDISPSNTPAMYGLGYALNELERYEDALTVLSKAAEDPDAQTGVFSQRSLARFSLGRYKLAIKDADRVIRDWPENSAGFVRKARALSALGQRQTGIEELTAFLEQRQSDFARYWLSSLLHDDGDFTEALAVLDPIFTDGEPDKYDKELRALLLTELDRFDEARVAIELAREAAPNSPYPPYYLALVLAGQGEFDAAEESFETALEQGLPKGQIRFFLQALAERGQYVRMVQWRLRRAELGN